MSEPAESAPPPEADTTTQTINKTQKAGTKDKPKDSKGWDGKLRVEKNVQVDWPKEHGADSGAEESDDEGPPPEQLAADEDLLDDVPEDEEEIDLVHMRISSIPALRLERFPKLKRLCLRQNQIADIDLPTTFAPTLEELDLYDNLIAHIRNLDAFPALTSLDLSFNKLKHLRRLAPLPNLRDLYLVQNRISTIENLGHLTSLTQLELGANRIRQIQNLETLVALEQLWLGKNKITELAGLATLSNLKILSIQSNRLTEIKNLAALTSLEELHISHNALSRISGLDANLALRVLDVSANPIAHLEGLAHLPRLQELWASNCQLASFQEMETELGGMKELETVYFEGNPVQRTAGVMYRNKVRLAVPGIRQIDATFVRVD